MPFKQINVTEEINKMCESDAEFKGDIEESEIEYEFKKQLINLRKKNGITQQNISKKTGLKQQAISRIESDINSPTMKNIFKYLDALDLDLAIIPRENNSTSQGKRI